MDVFEAIRGRRSCRSFKPDPVDKEIVDQILEAGTWAPSPLNSQPWEFIVTTSTDMREKIYLEAERCRKWARDESGWAWLDKYSVDFVREAPLLIGVTGDPKKTGVDSLQDEGNVAYQYACAAAVQNMLLAAHALGVGGIWFTFFDRKNFRKILAVESERMPIGLVCLGYPKSEPRPVPRKDISKKTRIITD